MKFGKLESQFSSEGKYFSISGQYGFMGINIAFFSVINFGSIAGGYSTALKRSFAYPLMCLDFVLVWFGAFIFHDSFTFLLFCLSFGSSFHLHSRNFS
jgi:hypothetical protein